MAFEIIFLLLILIYVLTGKKERYLYAIIFFLPFNAFAKSYLDFLNLDSRLFAFWKEILILLFFVSSSNEIMRRCKLKGISIILALYVLLFFFVGCTLDPSSAVVKLRDCLFPILLLMAASSRSYSKKSICNMLMVFSTSILITCLAGFLETFGGYRMQIAIIKDALVGIGPDGTVYYPAAWMIMGHNRMVGLLDSPNQLGMLLAVYLLVSYFFGSYVNTKKKKRYMLLVQIMASICLILTFSRTAFALLAITYFCYLIISIRKGKNIGNSIAIILGVFAVFSVIFYLSSSLQDVVTGTASGKEASSADRGNNISSGLSFAFENILGYGLGSTRMKEDGKPVVFFAESGLIDLMIEQGILGLILLTVYFKKIYNSINRYCKDAKMVNFKLIFIATYICAWVSINPMEIIYTYYLMIFSGILIAQRLSFQKIANYENTCRLPMSH